MTPTYDEVETKYDVDETFELPPVAQLLAGLDSGASVEDGGADAMVLEATYFDTADHRLFHAGLTLRRRTGGADDGWHLKVPIAEGTRREVRAALGRSPRTVPARLRRMVWMHTRDLPLEPVLQVTTRRSEHHLVSDGQALADIADDRVTARPLGALAGLAGLAGVDGVNAVDGAERAVSPDLVWREVEVELVHGDRAFLKGVGQQLREFGARPSTSRSKLARGLGRVPDGDIERKALKRQKRQLSPSSSSGEVVVSYLARELHRIRVEDLSVRLDRPDSIHSMRVATRRLRGALRTFGTLFVPGTVQPLERELRWLADELGAARDAEVLRVRLLGAVGTEQARHLSTGQVTRTVDREMAKRQRAAFSGAAAALDDDRYRLLIAALEELVAHPPLTARGAKRADKQLRKQVAESYAEVRKALLAADGLASSDERDDQLHKARKAAKRARYAAEAVAPAFGKDATAFAAAMERLQEVLGERHDSVAMQQRLYELAKEAAPATAFTYGRLHARETAHQAQLDASIGPVWSAAAKKSLRGWLS
ncbi:MAG: CYTH and CHAD domain-containing protein [Actinomycetota bacterium]|nr:CYTH and CHAD domain-containing protein [Actinomycetota bacterium]